MDGGTKPDIRLVMASLGGGGAERVAVRLGNEWTRQGIRVEFLLARRQGAFLEHLAQGTMVYSPDTRRTLTALPALARRLAVHRDVPAILFGIDLGVGLGGMKRLGLLSTPLIYREGSLPRQNVSRAALWRYRAFVNGVDGVIAQSNHVAAELCDLGVGGMPMQVIPNPVQYAGFSCRPREKKSLVAGVRILAMGRLGREKGFARLVGAWPAVLRRFPNSQLTIAGEGPGRLELKALITQLGLIDSVLLPGFSEEVERLYEDADVFVLSSYYEGQPNVLIEALLNGCRVVAAGGPGVKELLEAAGLGACWLPDDEFESGLPDRIAQVLTLGETQIERSVEWVKQNSNVTRVAQEYWEFCKTVVATI